MGANRERAMGGNRAKYKTESDKKDREMLNRVKDTLQPDSLVLCSSVKRIQSEIISAEGRSAANALAKHQFALPAWKQPKRADFCKVEQIPSDALQIIAAAEERSKRRMQVYLWRGCQSSAGQPG